MALIHQKLYQENHLAGVKSKEYIEDLAETLRNTYALHTDIEFQYDVDDLIIDVDTIIPLGLILNELICNSLKHAFPEQKRGIIRIELKEKDQKLILKVCDNGVGMIPSEGTSFGIVLIESLAQKLKATIETHTNNGTCTQVTISHYKLVK
jgi:two-component sensor histidine kinase